MDHSNLNCFTEPFQFHMLMIIQVQLALHASAWFITLILEKPYRHIPISSRYRHFLAVQVRDTAVQFTVLPFSLDIAPRVLTKMMKPVAQVLSHLGVEILMYLYDWLVPSLDHLQCEVHCNLTLLLAHQSGLLINFTKSHLIPIQEGMGLSDSCSLIITRQLLKSIVKDALCPICLEQSQSSVGKPSKLIQLCGGKWFQWAVYVTLPRL